VCEHFVRWQHRWGLIFCFFSIKGKEKGKMHETNHSAIAAPHGLLLYQPFVRAASHSCSLTVGVAHG
jgi:hypothetical protein